jgi:hypothetical protein
MESLLIERLRKSFALWEDLAMHLPQEAFTTCLPVPSNMIGEQFWCLIGARESYTRAVSAGSWQGFACSLTTDEIASREGTLRGLQGSAEGFVSTVASLDWDDARLCILLELLEHEVQHMGQLIRYCYGLGYDFPPSWQKRWALG